MFKVLLNFLLVSFTWISAQEMDVTILPSEVTSLPFEKKPHDVFQADSNKSILLISSDRNQLETIATHPVKGITPTLTPTLTLTPAPVPTPVPIAIVNPHLGIIPLDSSSLAVQEKRMKNTLETQEYITYTVMNALMGLNLGYRGDLSFHSSHLTFHTYVGLFCYESEVVLKEGNFQDWTHYLGGGIGSFLQLQYGFLKGPNSLRTKLNLPLGPSFLAGVSWDSEENFRMSLEYNFLISYLLEKS